MARVLYNTDMNIISQMLVIIAAVCWGLLGIFTRPLMAEGLTPVDIVAARNIITAVCLFMFMSLTDREKLKIRLKDLKIFICMGVFGLALNSSFYFLAMNLISLSAASILLYTSPYMVMLQSAIVFKEKITAQKTSALFIAFTGCVMTVGVISDVNISVLGIAAGLAAAFFYSLYTILGKAALSKHAHFTVTSYSFAVAGLLMAPFCNFGKIFALSIVGGNLMNLLVVSFCLTLLPFVCYLKGLEKLEPSRASIISFAEPLTAAIAGIAVYNEMLSAVKILGGALIFLSLIVLNIRFKRRF